MNTERKYAPNGETTTHSQGTVQNPSQQPQKPDNWQEFFLAHVADDYLERESLFRLLSKVSDIQEHLDPIPGICLALTHYLKTAPRSVVRESAEIGAVITLIGQLSELRADFTVFNENTGFVDRLVEVEEKEVSHD